MRVLVVEDDEQLGPALRAGLIQQGHTVDLLGDGQAALQALQVEAFDVVVLDLGLPRMAGLPLLQNMRAMGIDVPVLILTAKDSIEDRVKGLDYGADDYLTKPFDLDELGARLRALQRRSSHGRAEPTIKYANVELDPASHVVTQEGEIVNLPRREFALLQKLLENVGHVLSRDTLMQCLYGWGEEVDSNTLEVHIHNLRKRLNATFIRTIRGVGYMVEKEK